MRMANLRLASSSQSTSVTDVARTRDRYGVLRATPLAPQPEVATFARCSLRLPRSERGTRRCLKLPPGWGPIAEHGLERVRHALAPRNAPVGAIGCDHENHVVRVRDHHHVVTGLDPSARLQ